MKFLYILLSMTSLLWLASGCSKNNAEEYDPQPQKELKNKPQWAGQSSQTVSESPVWQVAESPERDNSMVATIAVDSTLAMMSDGDKVAAFCEGVCLGVAEANSSSAYGCRFYLYINQPTGEKKDITIGYYSDNNKKVYYWIDHMRFVTDSKNGSTAEPMILTSAGENNGCPFKTTVSLGLPESLNINLSGDDMLAIFAGDECRVCLKDSDRMNEGNRFLISTPMKDTSEQFTIRLYSSRDDKIYTSDAYTVTSTDIATISNVMLK